MSKHTPGPWLLSDRTIYALNDQGVNRFYALVQDAHAPAYELNANARLMAVAPELLESLEESFECASILRNLIENIEAHGNYSEESMINFLNQALSCHRLSAAAIAKARGEQ